MFIIYTKRYEHFRLFVILVILHRLISQVEGWHGVNNYFAEVIIFNFVWKKLDEFITFVINLFVLLVTVTVVRLAD